MANQVFPKPIRPSKPADWMVLYDSIHQLYWIEDRTLEDTMSIVQDRHNFYATSASFHPACGNPALLTIRAGKKQWVSKLQQWKLKKNISSKKMERIVQIQRKRRDENRKETRFLFRGRPITENNIARWQKRRKKVADQRTVSPLPQAVSTPSDIAYDTASERTSSRPPSEAPLDSRHDGSIPQSSPQHNWSTSPSNTPAPFFSLDNAMGAIKNPDGDLFLMSNAWNSPQFHLPSKLPTSGRSQPSGENVPFVSALGECDADQPWPSDELFGAQDFKGGVNERKPEPNADEDIILSSPDYSQYLNFSPEISQSRLSELDERELNIHSKDRTIEFTQDSMSNFSSRPDDDEDDDEDDDVVEISRDEMYDSDSTDSSVATIRAHDYDVALQHHRTTAFQRPATKADWNQGLRAAARIGDVDLMQHHLESGADIESRSESGMNALHAAVFYGHFAASALLIQRGADVEALVHGVCEVPYTSDDVRRVAVLVGPRPIHLAASRGNVDILSLLLDNHAEPHGTGIDRFTALNWAEKFCLQPIIKLLVDRGAVFRHPIGLAFDKDMKRIVFGLKALIEATMSGSVRLVQLALNKYDHHVNSRDDYGNPLLSLAVAGNFEQLADLLLAEGADATAVDAAGRTPLDLATEIGNEAMAGLLYGKYCVDFYEKNGQREMAASLAWERLSLNPRSWCWSAVLRRVNRRHARELNVEREEWFRKGSAIRMLNSRRLEPWTLDFSEWVA
ncbi:ankyrin repeat-containing domain protein [Cercophora newfieldiana]|uniref:Ankyrin repeat-containing domain protein n=1 Tax=Cercophora newfieldiana TaxID=92897 RepID=A0AA39XT93_9PEZI|nr:ankyrin repeat-containing domain protein [Cercophora newfieldiana]